MSNAVEFRELQRQYPCLARGGFGRWHKVGGNWVVLDYYAQIVDGAVLRAHLKFNPQRETLTLDISLTQHCQQATKALNINAVYLNPVAARSEAIGVILESLAELRAVLGAKLRDLEGVTAW